MANILIGSKNEETKNSKGIIQFSVGGNTYQYKFTNAFEWTLDDTDVEIVRIDDLAPVFARVGDILGSFRIDLTNTIDIYQGVTPATSQWLASYWLEQIKQDLFPEIDFIETMDAPKSTGDKFARINMKLRIMKVLRKREKDRAFSDIAIEGSIIAFTSALRAVS